LFGRDPEEFWELLADCQRVEFCVGVRKASEWPGADYVISADVQLIHKLLSKIEHWKYNRVRSATKGDGEDECGAWVGDGGEDNGVRIPHLLSDLHWAKAPGRYARQDDPGADWERICRRAQKVYQTPSRHEDNRALAATGSIKVNPVVELMLATTFRARPFGVPEAGTSAIQRRCPLFFAFRPNDPQPPSCCGGSWLVTADESTSPGIYCERDDRRWHYSPCDQDHDAAFLFYGNKRPSGLVEVACGGFSARATELMAKHLDRITSRLGSPQYFGPELMLGLYVIEFTRRRAARDCEESHNELDWDFKVVPVGKAAIQRRLETRRSLQGMGKRKGRQEPSRRSTKRVAAGAQGSSWLHVCGTCASLLSCGWQAGSMPHVGRPHSKE